MGQNMVLFLRCIHHCHTALKPKHLKNFFEPVFKQAEDLQQAYASCGPTEKPNFRVPFVTVSARQQGKIFKYHCDIMMIQIFLRCILMRSTHVHVLVCSKRLLLIEPLMGR